MIEVLKPVWKQFEETYADLRFSLANVADTDLIWSPGGEAKSIATLIFHIADANITYVSQMDGNERVLAWEESGAPSRAQFEEWLSESERCVRDVFEAMTTESITRYCAYDWSPLSDDILVDGPLDAFWFALQVMRHSAYHLGQLNAYRLILAAHPTS